MSSSPARAVYRSIHRRQEKPWFHDAIEPALSIVIRHHMTADSFVIGCDVGTQSTKAVLVNTSGAVIASASEPHTVRFPAAGWADQDFNDWTAAVESVLSKLAAAGHGPITHVGIAAQVDGVVPLDADLAPIGPAIIWLDRRGAAYAASAAAHLGTDAIYAITGLNCDGSHGAPKMRWALDNLATRPRYLLPPASAIGAWLTGSVTQDHANASSSMLYDVSRRAWAPEMVHEFSIPAEFLTDIVESTSVIGAIRPDLADRIGLSRNCQVIAGTGDDHASAVGVGATKPGIVADISGTAEPVGTTALTPHFDPGHLVEAHAHAVPGAFFIENPGFVSGGSVMWLAGLLGVTQSEVFELASKAGAGSRSLIFIPALSGSMTPRWNDLARGSFTGASMEHGRAELARSVLEGCVFAVRDIVDRLDEMGLPTEAVHVTGGGARSSLWLQMRADVLGRPVRPVLGEACAVGAACLAAVAASWFPDVVAASSVFANPGRDFEPAPDAVEVYADAYQRYRLTFDALEETWTQP